MDKKNDFDELILDKTNKSERLKKLLIRLIALVILFLAVIIVMKLINGSEEPPAPLPAEPSAKQEGFEDVQVAQANQEDEFEALRRQLQGEANTSEANATGEAALPVEELPATDLAQNEQGQNEQGQNGQDEGAEANSAEDTAATPLPAEPAAKAAAKPAPKPAPKPAATPKPAKPAAPAQSAPKAASQPNELFKAVSGTQATPGLYVQIFSISNLDPKSRELTAVKNKGYEYKFFKTEDGKTKVLIGPFKREELRAALAKIRAELAKDAFAFTVK